MAEAHEPQAWSDDLEVRLAPMRRRHLRSVVRIEQRVYSRPWSYGLFLGEIGQRATRVYLVARVGGTVVGYAGSFQAVDESHITTVVVDPDWHRRGIATRLLVAQARAAADRGSHNLTLEVRVSNGGAQALYRRFGFVPAGMRKAYYPDNREDALVMWAHDIDKPDYAARLTGIEAGLRGTTVFEGGWV
ncbi:MAG TPA: ribosomal protein S18-alanine N-acetyltransferase [Acidimicrobiales bacterium]|nr:ribosomal protein S18-alanine N-acetyltransferase [Acidimicrobiales bacterium]